MNISKSYDFKILEWDTDFFGFNVAQILPKKLDFKRLENVLETLKGLNTAVAYWASDSTDNETQRAADYLKGFLADKKTTYTINLNEIEPKDLEVSVLIKEYKSTKPNSDLINLAVQSGEYSRFKVDPKFSKQQFENLYKKWIEQSTNKTIADTVLVIRENEKIVGMISLLIKMAEAK